MNVPGLTLALDGREIFLIELNDEDRILSCIFGMCTADGRYVVSDPGMVGDTKMARTYISETGADMNSNILNHIIGYDVMQALANCSNIIGIPLDQDAFLDKTVNKFIETIAEYMIDPMVVDGLYGSIENTRFAKSAVVTTTKQWMVAGLYNY